MTLVATVVVPPGDAATPQAVGTGWTQFYTLVFSGSYVTGGEPWNPIPSFAGPTPSTVLLVDVAGGAGYGMEYDKVNAKLKVFSAAGTELAAGAYPAALSGDVNIVAQVNAK